MDGTGKQVYSGLGDPAGSATGARNGREPDRPDGPPTAIASTQAVALTPKTGRWYKLTPLPWDTLFPDSSVGRAADC